ncbi:TerD family protein [Xenorhabdus bovienii]|uniref:Tellurium resistance protein terA n=1 Tax=Xenorhabdus bovienii str. Intermedium TaxID=1379677 RepID=A0A077QGK6_XENBV|nr:TerD family protein [Xenorhabdus bovienii]MDE9452524.1 TerD family protein [Xenorhabdus bovienii]MDE9542015.1 TerD family protein [Xenorhabdus bovienii]MDE9555937.1 TerD family protein [Xenorhabdus bovienii]MDE9563697.1 TerD family protein [Xenorhabdus bovienii]CDH32273.1 tellurium resistance protein terA [Xenorhabdus bovienii str. Intermedium]
MNLTPGGNAPVSNQTLTVRVLSGTAVDVSAFRLYADGKVQGDPDMVFYGQPVNDDNTIRQAGGNVNTSFFVNLPTLRHDVQKVAFTVTCDGNQTISSLRTLSIQVELNGSTVLQGSVDVQGRTESALILGELYRRNSEWKFRFIAQGFNGGLKPLAEHFGVNIVDDAPAKTPAPPPAPAPAPNSVNLSKVSLTKEKPAISLSKRDNFGEIRVNLNWNQAASPAKKGVLQGIFSANKGVDLDLGAFIRLHDGERYVVQAIGKSFGDYHREPYVKLQGDDRTGAVRDGEWLHINGLEWKNINEVLVYALIYEGVPSWDNTDGVVTIHISGQAPIETRMTEGNNQKRMCAVGRLVNENGAIKVERINQYFSGHKEMDRAFGWGFRWVAGSK